MFDIGLIEWSEIPYASLLVCRKPDWSYRYCCDMSFINQKTLFDAEPISDQEEIFAKLAKKNYFSKIDVNEGYFSRYQWKRSRNHILLLSLMMANSHSR